MQPNQNFDMIKAFTRLQRATVVSEILVSKGQLGLTNDVLIEISSIVNDIKTHIGAYMDKDKNFTSTPIEGGEKTPQNNQGTIPAPETGSNTGVGNADATQFTKTGSTKQNPTPGNKAPDKADTDEITG